MCLAAAAVITALDKYNDRYAYAERMGIVQKINVQLIDSPAVGDMVLIHAGFAIEKIDKERFDFINNAYKEMDTE